MEEDIWNQFPDAPKATQGDGWDQFQDAPVDGPKGQEVTNLPAPRPNMFGSMDDETAQTVYNSYANHPNAQTDPETGELLYNGVPVPKPEGNSPLVDTVSKLGALALNPAGPIYDYLVGEDSVLGEANNVGQNLAEGVTGGVINAGKNVAELATSVATTSPIIEGYKTLTGGEGPAIYETVRDKATRGVQDTLPEFNPEGTAQSLGATAGEVGAGIVLGNKVLATAKAAGVADSAITSLSTKLPKAIAYLSNVLVKSAASGAGTAATVDGKSDTLLVGPDALAAGKIPWTDISIQENIPILKGLDGLDENEAQAVLEQRFNVLADSIILAAPIEMAADGGKKLTQFLLDRFVTPIHGAVSESKKAEIVMADLMDNVAKAVDPANPNSETALKYKQRVVDILSDPENSDILFKSSKEGIDDVSVSLDTASTIDRGFADDASEEAASVKKLFGERRKAVIEHGGDHVKTAIATERPVRATEKFLDQGQEAFGGDIGIDTARQGIQQAGKEEVDRAAADVANTQFDLEKMQSSYPDVIRQDAGIGERLAKTEGQAGSAAKLDRNVIGKELAEAEETGSKVINEQGRKLWKDIPEGLEVDEASLEEALVNASDYVNKPMAKVLKNAGVEIAEDGTISGGDFAKLQELRKPLNDEIKRLKISGGAGLNELIELRNNITEVQPDFLKSVDSEGGKAVQRAVDYHKEVRGPVAKSGLPGEIDKIRKMTGLDEPVKADKIQQAIHNTLTSEFPNVPTHFAETLARPEYGKVHGKIVDYALADAADKMRAKIATSGIGSIDPKDILDGLSPYRQVLNTNPELFGEQLSRLDDFERNLIKHKDNIKGLESVLKEQAQNATEISDEIYKNVLNDFFSKEGVPNPNGYETFKRLFADQQATGKTAAGKLDQIIARAEESKDPAVLEGMKAAWFKYVKDQAFTPAPGVTGRAISGAKVEDMLTGENNILAVGKKLFKGEDAPIVDVLEKVLNPSLDVTIAKKGASFKGAENPASMNAAKRAVNRIVLATLGPLTRKGAKVSVIASTILDKLNPNDATAKIADKIMADPKGFLEVYQKFASKAGKTSENGRLLFNWLVRSSLYNEGDYNRWKDQYDKLNTEDQTEEILTKE